MSDQYEHEIADLKDELTNSDTEINTLRGTVYELRNTVRHLNQTILSQREINGNQHNRLETQRRCINRMRNCHNCNEVGCAQASDDKAGSECMDNDRKFWEMKQWLTGSGTTG